MKAKIILATMLCLAISNSAEAQFLKKLKKKAEQAAERAILNKTEEKVSQKTGNAIDSVTKGDKNRKESANTKEQTNEKKPVKEFTPEEQKVREKKTNAMMGVGNLEGIPNTYEFTYQMNMNITNDNKTFDVLYYLKPESDYFGNSPQDNQNNSIIVFDMKNNAMVTFIDNGQQKMAMRMNMVLNKKFQKKFDENSKKSSSEIQDAQITPIEDKTIIGYKCKGYQLTTKEGVSIFWVTNDAPSMMGMFGIITKNFPESVQNASLPFTKNSLMLEMQFESNRRKKDNMHMLCTSLEKHPLTINKNEYKVGM